MAEKLKPRVILLATQPDDRKTIERIKALKAWGKQEGIDLGAFNWRLSHLDALDRSAGAHLLVRLEPVPEQEPGVKNLIPGKNRRETLEERWEKINYTKRDLYDFLRLNYKEIGVPILNVHGVKMGEVKRLIKKHTTPKIVQRLETLRKRPVGPWERRAWGLVEKGLKAYFQVRSRLKGKKARKRPVSRVGQKKKRAEKERRKRLPRRHRL